MRSRVGDPLRCLQANPVLLERLKESLFAKNRHFSLVFDACFLAVSQGRTEAAPTANFEHRQP